MTAKEKNIGNTTPIASLLSTLLDLPTNSIKATVITPNTPALIIKNGDSKSLVIKNASTIPKSTEWDMASAIIERFLRTKNTPSKLQLIDVISNTACDPSIILSSLILLIC